eukprot:Hpha_TRINITY_DN15603_c0_g11::TRINITY_DN15603_c0_g11_i1::g.98526::m.98526
MVKRTCVLMREVRYMLAEGRSLAEIATTKNISTKTLSHWFPSGERSRIRSDGIEKTFKTLTAGHGTWGRRKIYELSKIKKTRISMEQIRRLQSKLHPELTRWKRRVRYIRTEYEVERPLQNVCVDGNEKVIHAGVFIVAGVDAYSLRPLYVLPVPWKTGDAHLFGLQIIRSRHGTPERISMDKGSENFPLRDEIRRIHNNQRAANITRSIRNIKVERFWGDFNMGIQHPLRREIKIFKRETDFNEDNPLHALALQIATYNFIITRLPEYLHVLNCVPVYRKRGRPNRHLNGKSRYDVLPSPYDDHHSVVQSLIAWEKHMKANDVWVSPHVTTVKLWDTISMTRVPGVPLEQLFRCVYQRLR